MKLLLDENLPKRLKTDLALHEVYTVRDMGWNGTKNGELLKLMQAEQFDALITFDKNLQYQQSFSKYSLPVLVLNAKNNTYLDLKALMPKTLQILQQPLNAGATVISF
jgi:predicted nuclease of predicted toxin-antitoxin system